MSRSRVQEVQVKKSSFTNISNVIITTKHAICASMLETKSHVTFIGLHSLLTLFLCVLSLDVLSKL